MDRNRLLELARQFKDEQETSTDLVSHLAEHKQRIDRARKLLTLERIPGLTVEELRDLIKGTDGWNTFLLGKGVSLDHFLEDRDHIANTLFQLIEAAEGDLSPEDFENSRKVFGKLTSELLALRFPERYWIWNRPIEDFLKKAGMDPRSDLSWGQKSEANVYFAAGRKLDVICQALHEVGCADVNYMFADVFIWWARNRIDGGINEIEGYFSSEGLHFTPHQLATFYTALKTKGFVILTGISGTGKTKLAQCFVELFPAPERTVTEEPEDAETVIRLQIQPYMLKYTRLIVPKGYWKLLDVPAAGETVEVELTFDGKSETCRLTHASYGAADYLQILFRGKARKWLTANFHEDDIIILEPAFSDEGDFSGFHLRKPEAKQVRKREPNFYFSSVRPDWKDSKSLLGYYNPLSEQFESTNFLRFILKAHQNLAVPYFVLLDEMNLAKVEYYFADFLSVLESGRREDDFTKEAIRFQYPEGIDGPPRELYLPPNLYFIGTVNVDETTYMFSPKVLDRAFTLELSTVEFPEYINSTTEGEFKLSPDEQQSLLEDFTRDGNFATIGKSEKEQIKAFSKQPDGKYKTYAEHLTTLNSLLQPYDLHFGYRVFDEIMMFLANAEGSPVFDGFNGGLDAAFDAAVLMKVLPKFHGTRGKLKLPLLNVFAWAMTPGAGRELRKQAEELEKEIAGSEEKEKARLDLIEELRGSPGEAGIGGKTFAYPRTALKALRMLHDLYTTGFASFA